MKNSFISKLNVNQLKVFEAVYRLKSMTLAAQELFLTQSGISQHIKKLEEQLHITLFVRNHAEFFSTSQADELYLVCKKAFTEIESTLDRLSDIVPKQLEGIIRIGVPTEFGNNILIPSIAEWAKNNPSVKFDFVYGYASHLSGLLSDEKIDLAFIDSFKSDRQINSKIVFQETLNLVASQEYIKIKKVAIKNQQKDKLSSLTQLDFIEYDHKESIIRLWFDFHFGKKNLPLNIRVWAMNVQGVAAFIRADMGAAVLPNHIIEKIIREGTSLHLFKGNKDNLNNEISIAWLKRKPLSRAVNELKEFLINTKMNLIS
ncbi:MAG: LysR family transcriptional regulator [Bdellovibrionaceae bacterium]|nr:LysR family transcriptional regulator [Pseudobdellovibrionaceae bacterium]NUM58063.1 LysR family transcriptional regulator [Pseudobdellovibrionaceae bacterium]